MKNILIPYSVRAEKGLLDPIINQIEKSIKFNVDIVDLNKLIHPYIITNSSLYQIYDKVRMYIITHNIELVLCPFDRREMIFVALAANYLRIPIITLHSGEVERVSGSTDTMNRHAIMLYSDVQFCNGKESHKNALKILKSVGKSIDNCYDIGSTAFDFKESDLDYSKVPSEPYDIVVYNVPTLYPEVMNKELSKISNLIDKKTIWLCPVEDDGSANILKFIEDQVNKNKNITLSDSLPRMQFLALIKNAQRVIGNSSSFILEAPYFLKDNQIIHIGLRNGSRKRIKVQKGGSKKFVEILEGLD